MYTVETRMELDTLLRDIKEHIKHQCIYFCRLHVHYPPHVELIADHGVDGYVEEGSRVRFRCKAHANPPQMSYTWYVGGRRVADAPEASTELVLDHVDRRLHNHVVRCEVTNPIGKTDESALLNVACK